MNFPLLSQFLDRSLFMRLASWIPRGVLQWPGSMGPLSVFAGTVANLSSYAISWLVCLPLEIVAASITLSYWEGAREVNNAAWVTIFLVVIIVYVRAYFG